MTLELDLGNSYLKWRYGSLRGRLDCSTLTEEALAAAWGALSPDTVLLAAVGRPVVQQLLEDYCQRCWRQSVWRAETAARCLGVCNSYQQPERMGVDRWLAMLAVYQKVQSSCCIVDCGSAITVDYLAADGAHLGGYIMPGLRLMRAGLLGNTSQIRVNFDLEADTTPGCSTEAAVQHGLLLMFAAMAERVARDHKALLGDASPLWVAGGDAALFQRWVPGAVREDDLVLDGLRLAHQAEVNGCAG